MTTELVELANRLDTKVCDLWLVGSNYREGTSGWNTYNDLIKLLTEAATAIRALASRAGGSDGWVAVTDRLPEPYQDVEVYPSWDDDTSNTYCPHDGGTNGRKAGNWYHNDREGYDHEMDVTHWRPRAKPPAAPEPLAVG